MDFLDRVQRIEEEQREAALAAARTGNEGPRPRGSCLLCEEVVPDGQRWCDAVCRDRWQIEADASRRFPRVQED